MFVGVCVCVCDCMSAAHDKNIKNRFRRNELVDTLKHIYTLICIETKYSIKQKQK